MLRCASNGVQALRLRRPFSIDPRASERYDDLPLGPLKREEGRRNKRCLDMDTVYPQALQEMCWPRTLIFPEIVAEQH
jgi:hypothetical protein